MSVASDVGHGGLGLRSNLQDVLDLTEESASEKLVLVDMRLGKVVTGWGVYSGATYVAACAENWNKVYRDVVRVKTLIETLARAESLADCQATAGTFFYDPDQFISGAPAWDDGVTLWDSSAKWDSGALYVHLTGDADPRATTIEAHFGIFVSNEPRVEPHLSAEKLDDGGFEVWTDQFTPTNWTTSGSPGWKVIQETSRVRQGASAAALTAGAGAGNIDIYTEKPTVAGKLYRFAVSYFVPVGFTAEGTPTAELAVSDGGGNANIVQSDGRTYASGTLILGYTEGYWRRAIIDFVARTSSTRVRLRVARSPDVGAIIAVTFDDASFRRIWRYDYYEPRVATATLPSSDTARQDIYFGAWTVGNGSLQLLNEGALEDLFGRFNGLYKSYVMRYGGRFRGGGNEVTFDNMVIGWNGFGKKVAVTDKLATIDLEDLRGAWKTGLPARVLDLAAYPNMDPQMSGAPQPIAIGAQVHVKAVRVDKTTDGYGVYYLNDPAYAPDTARTFSLRTVWSYTSEEAADKENTLERVGVLNSINANPVAGTASFAANPKVFRVVSGLNDRMDFDIGAGALVAILTPGLYVPDGGTGTPRLTTMLKTAFQTADAGGTYTVSYDPTVHKLTIARTGGTLNLRLAPGSANRNRSGYPLVGFTAATDKTGSTSYTADDAIFSDADAEHVIRWEFDGYKDDASGSFTGTAAALIKVAADVARLVLTKMLGVMEAGIDAPSFNLVRSNAPQVLSLYLGAMDKGKKASSGLQVMDVLGRIEASVAGDILTDGSFWYFKLRDAGAPAALTLYDRDYKGWEAHVEAEDAFWVVRIRWSQDPSLGTWAALHRVNVAVPLIYGRVQGKTFETCLTSYADAAALLARYAAIAAAPPRRFGFSVKSRAIRLIVGDTLAVTRSRGLAAGTFDNPKGRIISKKNAYAQMESAIVAVEVTQ